MLHIPSIVLFSRKCCMCGNMDNKSCYSWCFILNLGTSLLLVWTSLLCEEECFYLRKNSNL